MGIYGFRTCFFREGDRPELQRGWGRTHESERGDKVGGNRMQEACLSLACAAALDQELPRVEACGGGG